MKTTDSKMTQIKDEEPEHLFTSHPKMVVFCCGIPLVGFLIFASLGITAQSLEMILLLICPISLIAMLIMMKIKPIEHIQMCYEGPDQLVEEPVNLDNIPDDEDINLVRPVDPERLVRRRTIQKPLLYPRNVRRYRTVRYPNRTSLPD